MPVSNAVGWVVGPTWLMTVSPDLRTYVSVPPAPPRSCTAPFAKVVVTVVLVVAFGPPAAGGALAWTLMSAATGELQLYTHPLRADGVPAWPCSPVPCTWKRSPRPSSASPPL